MVEQLFTALNTSQPYYPHDGSRWLIQLTHFVSDGPWFESQTLQMRYAVSEEQLVITEQQLFDELAERLEADTLTVASPKRMLLNQNALVIKKMTRDLVLRGAISRVENRPVMWMTLLQELTGESPIAVHERGQVALMVARWQSWARNRGLI